MLLWTIINVALKSLLANKLRSVLAMLGIIIGVGAVISMLALGTGAQKQVLERVSAMGTDLLIVRPGAAQRGGVRGGDRESLKLEDAEAILSEVQGVEAVAPLATGRAQVTYFNKNMNTNITGATGTYFGLRNFELSSGRIFTTIEEERSARVAILGADAAGKLFGAADPVGEQVRVKNVNFRVIGVLKAKGDQGWFNPDEMVAIPYTLAMKQVLGQRHLSEVDVKIAAGADLTKVQTEVTQLLHTRHRIRAGAEDDFNIRNQAETIEMASSFTQTFTILLGGIAGISLIVGGIGIMNIMLVTVTERTREIGVRKAIGARDRDILRQFLLESILISALGGLLGVGFGFAASAVVGKFSDFVPIIEPANVLLSLGVAVSVGIFFGYYPAYRASRLNPIDALRYE